MSEDLVYYRSELSMIEIHTFKTLIFIRISPVFLLGFQIGIKGKDPNSISFHIADLIHKALQ